jgi:di/tricarboxylate transporter
VPSGVHAGKLPGIIRVSSQQRDRRFAPHQLRQALTRARSRVRASSLPLRRLLALCVAAVAAAFWFATPPSDLSVGGHRVLVTVGAMLALGLLDVVPDYMLGLLMVAVWAATGTVPASVTASGLATSTCVLLLASLTIGVAVARSGLLFRVALDVTRRLPPSHALRCAGLAVLGLIATGAMPSAFSRLALASPIAQDIADSLRETPGGRRAAGLGLATFIGFGQLGTLFLTGSSATLVAYGLLPPDVQAAFGWGTWVVAALPAHLILLGLSLSFIAVCFRGEGRQVSAETLQLQRQVLGRPSRDEIVVSAAMLVLVVGFVTQPLHGVNAAWLAVATVLVLAAVGILNDVIVRSGVNWGLLLYLGIVLGFGQVFAWVGLDIWLAAHMSRVADIVRGDAWLFLTIVLGVGTVAGLVLRAGPGSAVLCLVVFPVAPLVGVSKWVVALTVLMATNLWLYPQQSVYYLIAYYASHGRGFTHAQARPLAFAYAVFVWISVLASIPYWRWLGLIT